MNFDFGHPEKINRLKDKYLVPPFSILDSKTGDWQNRKRLWIAKGIKSELGRDNELVYHSDNIREFDHYRVKEGNRDSTDSQGTSIFDPVLCEVLYHWFCPPNGKILDPFAGGSVRGIVAHYLGYHYTGIELQQKQVDANRQNAHDILPLDNLPNWYVGDSDTILDNSFNNQFNFLFSCPPYMDLEKYSDDPNDLSILSDQQFVKKYESIIQKSTSKLTEGAFACFVIGEVRDKKTGFYKNFNGITKTAFKKVGWGLYNDAILLNVIGTAPVRAGKQFDSGRKLVKIHQNILVFKKE